MPKIVVRQNSAVKIINRQSSTYDRELPGFKKVPLYAKRNNGNNFKDPIKKLQNANSLRETPESDSRNINAIPTDRTNTDYRLASGLML